METIGYIFFIWILILMTIIVYNLTKINKE